MLLLHNLFWIDIISTTFFRDNAKIKVCLSDKHLRVGQQACQLIRQLGRAKLHDSERSITGFADVLRAQDVGVEIT